MKHWITLALTLAALTLAGCAVDVQAPAEPVGQDTQEMQDVTVRTYDLSKKGADGQNLFEDRTFKVAKSDFLAMKDPDIGKARQAISQYGCVVPWDISRYLVIWHENSMGSPYTCFKESGYMDLTTAYFSPPAGQCDWQSEPYRTQCYNYLRISGNVRTVWIGSTAIGITTECVFLADPIFEIWKSGMGSPNYRTNLPAGQVGAVGVSCY